MAEILENGTTNGHHEEEAAPAVMDIPKIKKVQLKLTDYMKRSLDIVASNEGFKNYELLLDHGCNIGDGFVGVVLRVTIQEIQSDKSLQVIVKIPPENQARRIEFKSMQLFKREVYAYNVFIPKFVEFQLENRIKPQDGFFNFPKVYFAEYNEELDDSIIIMEDLKLEGFQMWSKFKAIDFEHAKLVMASLGRLHAISFAFKKRKVPIFEEFKKMDDFMSGQLEDERFIQYLMMMFDQGMKTLDPNDKRSLAKMEKFKTHIKEFNDLLRTQEKQEPYSVVVHGDCWVNNFMFTYRNKRPDQIKFIDWQISRYCSPIQELVYFLFNCTDHSLRVKHYDELLQIYHNSLKALLNRLGGDVMTQFPQTALFRQLKIFGKYGILMSLFILPMLQTKNEELPDMDYIADAFKNAGKDGKDEMATKAMDMMFNNPNVSSEYDARMRGNIVDACLYGYL